MKVDPALIHRLFYPQVPLVFSAQLGGRVSAMPVVSYASLSDSPPLVGVSCYPQGFTCRLAQRARAFSLSVLDSSHAPSISRLASVSGAKVKDKLGDAGLRYSGGSRLAVPVLEAALATLECTLKSKLAFGDHLFLVGLVEAANSTDAFKEFWEYSKYAPLLYTGWRDGLTVYPGARRRTR